MGSRWIWTDTPEPKQAQFAGLPWLKPRECHELIDDIDNKYPDISSIDDIPEDEFTGMLIKHDTTVE